DNPQKAIVFWESTQNVIEENPKEYDIAISYAQGIPTYYVADRVTAKKKLAWVNVSYHPNEKVKAFQRKYYEQYNQIVVVSDLAKEVFLKAFPSFLDKVTIFYDLHNPDIVFQMSKENRGYDDFDGIKILTVGRLAYQKGYDIALGACKQLKEEGLNFKWFV